MSGLFPRLTQAVDVLLFNPPYVVTPSEEVGSTSIEASWAGGVNGREVTDRLLPLVPQLLSRRGCMYLVTIPENKPDDIAAQMAAHGYTSCVVLSRKSGPERLSIVKFYRDYAAVDDDDDDDAE